MAKFVGARDFFAGQGDLTPLYFVYGKETQRGAAEKGSPLERFDIFQTRPSLGAISKWLYESKVPSPTGKPHWSRETISKLLRNEKYVGDVLLQKTFIADLFSGKQVKNQGELERFLIQEHHPAIVSRELFETINQAREIDP